MAKVKTDEIIGGEKAQQVKPAVLSPIQQIIQAQAQADAMKDFESSKQKNFAAEILSRYDKRSVSGAGRTVEPYRESNYTGTPKGIYGATQGAQHYQTEADKALSIYSANPTPTNYGRARQAAEMYGGADYAKNALAIANPTPANYGAAINAGSSVGGAAGMLQNKQQEYYNWDTTVRPSYMTRSDLQEIDEKLADPNISGAEKIKLLESRRILEEEYGYGWQREGANKEYYTSDAALREALDEEDKARKAYLQSLVYSASGGRTEEDVKRIVSERKDALDKASARVVELGGTPNQTGFNRFFKSFGENYAGGVVNAVDEATKLAQLQAYRWGQALQTVPKEQRGLMQEKLGGEAQDYGEYLDSQERLGERLLNAGAADQAMLNVGRTKAQQTLIDVGMNAMNVGSDMALNAAGSMIGIPKLGKARLALGAYGSAAYEAKQRGANLTQQNIRGLASAAVETFSEGMFDGLAGAYGAGRADDMVDNLIGRIAKSDAARNAWRLVFSSAGEGAEEVFSDIAMGIVDHMMFGDKLFGEGWNLEEMGYDFFIGATIGFLGSSVDAAAGGYKGRNVTSEFFANAKKADLTFKEALTAYNAATDVKTKAAKQWLKGRNDELARITWETGEKAGADAKTIAKAAFLSQATGREVRFFNEAAGAKAIKNGYMKDGVIYINAQSVNPMAVVFSHELTHTLEGTAEYDALWQAVKQELTAMGRDYEQVSKAGIKQLYDDAGVELTDAELDREVMAQFAEKYLFTDEQKIMLFVKENRNGAARVWTWIKNTLRHVTGRSEKTFLEKAEKLYADAFKSAGNVQGTEQSGTRYELTEMYKDTEIDTARTYISYADKTASDEAIDDKLDNLISTGKVYKIKGNPENNEITDLSAARKAVDEAMRDSYGSDAINFEIGDYEVYAYLTREGRNHSKAYIPDEDRKTILAESRRIVPYAEYVYSSEHDKHSSAGKADIKAWDYFAAAVEIDHGENGVSRYGVLFEIRKLKTDPKRQLYKVNVNEKADAPLNAVLENQDGQFLKGTSTGIIKPQDTLNVKEEFSLSPATDAEYENAVESGDMETAQRMVDEAAKAAGYNIKAYHGTSSKGFTVFDNRKQRYGLFGTGFYFTQDMDVANSYTKKGEGDKPGVYDVYLKAEKPLDMDADANLEEWSIAAETLGTSPELEGNSLTWDELLEYAWEKGEIESGYRTHFTNEEVFRGLEKSLDEFGSRFRYENEGHIYGSLMEDAIENMGYDSITHIGGGRYNKNDDRRHRVYIVFDKEQIKSADPVTYDDNGDVIPLSERFKTENEDIRYSLSPAPDKTESYRALADRIKKAAASDIKVTELTQKIKDLAEYATGAMYDENEVRARAEKIAQDVLRESYETTDEAETLKSIKSFLRDTGISYPSKTAPTGYDSFEEFRRKNMGRLKFVENGRSVDSVYMELNEMYGERYFPTDIINQDDMLSQIEDVLNMDGKIGISETMSAADIDGITQMIVDQLIGSDALTKQPSTPKKINLSKRARETAASWYRDEQGKIARGIHKAFDLPEAMQPKFTSAVQILMNEYIRTGRITAETEREAFNEAYNIAKERETATLEGLETVLTFAKEKRPKNGTDDYESMRQMLSELYPNRKAETTEDLTKLLQLARKDAAKLQNTYEDDMAWAQNSFEEMLESVTPRLKKLRVYIESKQTVNETLSEKDSKAVDDILAKKTSLKRLDPKEYNIDAIRAELAKYEDVPPEKKTQYDEGETERIRVEQERYKKYREMVASGEVKTKMDGLKGKAKVSFDQISRALAKKMKYAMRSLWAVDNANVNEYAGRAVTEMLFSGGISRETIDALYKEASETGRKASAEYAEKYQKAAEYLSGITLKTPTNTEGEASPTESYTELTFAEDGMSIEEAYAELRKIAPELFDGSHETEKDMLWKMDNVAWRVKQAQGALKQAEETDPEFEQWRKNDFANSLYGQSAEIRRLKRYMDYRTKAEAGEYVMPENPTELYRKQRETSRALTKAKAKELLTAQDERAIDQIIKGKWTVDELDPAEYNVKGIKNVLPMAQEANDAAVAVRQYGAALRAQLDERAKKFTKNAQNWKDRRFGIVASINTMERNFIKAAGEDAQALIDEYLTPVHENEAKKNRELNGYIERVRALNISQDVAEGNKVSEAYAVQFLAEAKTALDQFKRDKRKTDKDGEPIKKGGMTEDEWQYAVKTLKDENQKLDYDKIDSCIKTMREMYEELFTKVNLARVNNGYEPMGYIEGYFPHFQTTEKDGILGIVHRIVGIDNVSNLPTEIAGTTENRKPGIKWFGNAQARTGYSTAYDAVEGFDRYVVGAMDVIHHTRDIQKLRALERELRFRTSDEGIKDRAAAIRDDTSYSDNERDALLNELYEDGKYELSNLTQEISEYTNLLAGKRSKLDRNAEKLLGRSFYDLAKAIEGRVAANMVAINPGSWLTNFIPIAQLNGFVDSKYILGAFRDIALASRDGTISREDMQDMSAFLTNRAGAERLTKTVTQNMSEWLSKPMEWIDMFTAEVVVRARVDQNLADGMSEENALREADQFAARLMADRSKGSMPTFFEARNPAIKLFTQFQFEVNNQLAHFGDMERESSGGADLAWRIIKYFLATWMYDELYEALVGRRPGMDPLNTINDVVGDLTGKKLPNLLRWRKEGVDAEKKDVYNTLLDIGEDIGENTPFVGGMLFDGGRIPISSALPDLDSLFKAISKGDISGKKRLDYLWKGISPVAFYQVLPFGGGQIKKVSEATLAMIRGGKYSTDNEGNKSLQYPVINDGSIFGNAMRWAQAALFGPSSTEYGREWIESGFKSFSVKSTEAYRAAVEAGADQRETYEFLMELNRIEKTDEASKAFNQRGYIESADVSGEAKYYAYYYLMATDKEMELMDSLTETDKGTLVDTLMGMKDAEKDAGKRNVLRNSKLSGDDKLAVYTSAFAKEKEEEIIGEMKDADPDKLVNTLMGMKDSEKSAEKWDVISKSGLTGAEKLRLYEYTLPAGTDGEENKEVTLIHELKNADQEKVFKTLVELKDYTKNKDKLNVIMKSGLSDKEKLAVYRNRISDERDDDIDAFKKAGMDIDEFMKVQQKYSEISDDKNSSASQKELKFISWLYSGKYNEKQREAIKGTFKYYNMNPANADKYEEMRAAKISDANAVKVVKAVTELKPLTGETSVKDWQKWEAICNLDLNANDKENIMRTYMSDAQVKKFDLATKYRVSADDYAGVMKLVDEKRKAKAKSEGKETATLSQDEVEAILNSYGGNSLSLSGKLIFGTGALTSMQKAALWQIIGGWKTTNNPYDKEVGQAVYDVMNSKGKASGSTLDPSTLSPAMRKLLGLD